MIKGECRVIQTDWAKYQEYAWPTVFTALPRVGDWVQAMEDCVELKVLRVIHCCGEYHLEPYIQILLGWEEGL